MLDRTSDLSHHTAARSRILVPNFNQMTSLLRITAFFLTAGVVFAEETQLSSHAASATDGSIVSLPAALDPTEAISKQEPVDFTVLASRTQRVRVVQAPPMDGLPPVTGTANLKVEMVKAPELPEPLESLAPLPVEDAAVVAQIQEFREEHRGDEFVVVCATVYDHTRTFLRIFPNGQTDQEVTVWSNIDFNHFTGVGSFRVTAADGTTRNIGLMMVLGNEPSVKDGAPSLPDLTKTGPSFLVTKGNSEALEPIDRLHQLYRNEGERMKQAFFAREKALEAKKAALLANPPKPLDVTIRFWQRPEPAAQESQQPDFR
jgi:hypothetical protein